MVTSQTSQCHIKVSASDIVTNVTTSQIFSGALHEDDPIPRNQDHESSLVFDRAGVAEQPAAEGPGARATPR